jgi:hypothetical protein
MGRQPEDANLKRCSCCKKIFSIDLFGNNRSKNDGKHHQCKVCQSSAVKKWQKKNPEWVSKKKKIYYQNNIENVKDRSSKHYYENKQYHLERMKMWRKDNPKKSLEICKNYRNNHPERYAAQMAVRREVKSGRLIKLKWCQICGKDQGEKRTQAHHASYDRIDWLSIIWLCDKHHKQIHNWLKRIKLET